MQLSKSLLQTIGVALSLGVSTNTVFAFSNECPGDSLASKKTPKQEKPMAEAKVVNLTKADTGEKLTDALEVKPENPQEQKKKEPLPTPEPPKTTPKVETSDFSWDNCGACCGRG